MPVTSAPYVAAGRSPDTKRLTARPERVARRFGGSGCIWQKTRAVRAARALRRAAHRPRPPTAWTPRTVARLHGGPHRGPRAVRMWQASAELSATTVALGEGGGRELDSPANFKRAYEVVGR